MRKIMLSGVALLGIVAGTPALGQGQAVPQLGIDTSGACRNLSVYDATRPGTDKMVPIGCVDTAIHEFNTGATVATPAGASVSRPLATRFGDIKVANDFGAAGTGAAIQSAIDAASTSRAGIVLVPAGDWTIMTTLALKTGVTLQMSPGAVLKPGANVDIVSLKPGATCVCKIDTSGFSGWNKVAIDIDGDNNALAIPYRLQTPTRIDAELIGATGTGAGTAVKLHADGIANARVMGVEARVRASGFEKGYWLRQTSTDLSKFVNGNRLEGFFAATLQSLLMESSHSNRYGLDGNQFWIQHQPLPGTTVPAMTIAGQQNDFDLLPWDWDGVAGASPKAVTVQAGLRTSRIEFRSDPAYLNWLTTDRSVQLTALNANGGLYLDRIRPRAADGVIEMLGADLRLSNTKSIKLQNAAGDTDNPALFATSGDLVVLQSFAGKDMALDVRKAGGILAIRENGANKLYVSGTGISLAGGEPFGVKVAAPATASSACTLGNWAADASYLYVCTSANAWRRAAITTW